MLAKWLRILPLALAAAPLMADQDDGPGRGVARISVINGDVSVRRGDSGDWVAAALNAPLVVEDRILTGANSRAEVQFDYANMIRLSGNAEVRFSEVEYKRYQVQVARGTVTFRVLRDQDAEVEISTPSISVRPVKRGIYRLTVHADGASEITVRAGEAEVFTPRGSERLRTGRTMLARGTQADPEFRYTNEIPEDEWDRWNERRDRDLERSRSYNYLSRDIYGAEDLDDHGRWVYDAPNGWVWAPRVVAGWAPYRYGRWSWVDYYGWSWISYDPWGWAPYHYGRWYHNARHGWCWYPGAIQARHYWSPALVAFIGFGNVGVGLGFGRVGWIPLAPFDPFHRWWGGGYYRGYRNPTYIDNSVTIVNNINVRNVYRNSRVVNSVTAVERGDFGRGRVGGGLRISDADFDRASVLRGQLPLAPTRDSLRLADRDPVVRGDDNGNSRFFARRQPAAVDRVSFADQQRGVEQVSRRTFGDSVPAVARGAEASGGGRGGDVSGGAWRRVEAPARSADQPARGVETNNGWRQFGSARVEQPSGRVESTGRGFGEPPAAIRGGSERSETNNGGEWRRFGSSTVRGGEDTGRVRSAERTDGGRGGEVRRDASPSMERTPEVRRDETPTRGSFDSPRMERRSEPSGRSERPSEPVRISPPIVRERGGEGFGGRGSGGVQRGGDSPSVRGGDGGGGASSSPRGGGGGGSERGGGAVRGGDGGGRGDGGARGAGRGRD